MRIETVGTRTDSVKLVLPREEKIRRVSALNQNHRYNSISLQEAVISVHSPPTDCSVDKSHTDGVDLSWTTSNACLAYYHLA